ncbi:MAG: hypothetical protein J6K20_01115 [Thermoguttaceae bacterium]|nr:hypothetical protein [Thermoguttaceae bacterium]
METSRLPFALTPPTPELETLVELLVDDELDAVERRALLERLDEIDGGWKYCATAFLEAQTLRNAFRFLDVPKRDAALFDAAENLESFSDFNACNAAPVAASRRDLPEPRIIPLNAAASRGRFRRSFGSDGSGGDGPRRIARFAATAAGFLLSVAFGALLYRQVAPTTFSTPRSAPGRLETGADFAVVEPPVSNVPLRRATPSASPIRYVTLRSPSRSLDDVAVPCVEGDWDDLAALRATRADFLDVPPPVVEALQTSGGRVQTVRDELRFPLADGRTIVLPVDVYEIRSEFVPIY